MAGPASLTKPEIHAGKETRSAHDRWLIAIGVVKLLKAVLFILLGIGAVKLLHKDLVDFVTHFITSLGFDSEGRIVSIILVKVAMIDPHRLKQISAGIFAYAALDILEGTGLILEKVWAEYVTLILTASFLPWEFFEILRHITWMKIGLTALNLLVVAYLIFVIQARIRYRRRRLVG